MGIWIETIIFTQVATVFNFGDSTSIQYINENVMQIGMIICGFYFCTKTVENVAQGIEYYFSETSSKTVVKKVSSTIQDVSEKIEDKPTESSDQTTSINTEEAVG